MLASEVHYPADVPAVLVLMEADPDILPFAGGTGILRSKGGRVLEFPPSIACLHRIPELRRTARTERYLEAGAMLTLSEIAGMAPGTLPEPLREIAARVATRPVRNLATIGGNLSSRDRFMDLWAPLACMDAVAEFRTSAGSRWMNVNRLADQDGSPAFPRGQLLTRIRIPLEHWNFRVHSKTGTECWPSVDSGVFCCLGRTERGILDEFRLVWAGARAFRSRELESALTGRRLPLPDRECASFRAGAREAFSELMPAGAVGEDTRLAFASLVDAVLARLSR